MKASLCGIGFQVYLRLKRQGFRRYLGHDSVLWEPAVALSAETRHIIRLRLAEPCPSGFWQPDRTRSRWDWYVSSSKSCAWEMKRFLERREFISSVVCITFDPSVLWRSWMKGSVAHWLLLFLLLCAPACCCSMLQDMLLCRIIYSLQPLCREQAKQLHVGSLCVRPLYSGLWKNSFFSLF